MNHLGAGVAIMNIIPRWPAAGPLSAAPPSRAVRDDGDLGSRAVGDDGDLGSRAVGDDGDGMVTCGW